MELEKDNRKPSETHNSYWIKAFNEVDNYKIERKRSGKWLIFEHEEDLDETWDKIKKATKQGLLGSHSKTSTAKLNTNASNPKIKVICVYTADFDEIDDLKRIEKSIRNLGIRNKLIYKLNKDVGRYHKDGQKKLSQKISYSTNYYEVINWLNRNHSNKNISYIGKNKRGKKSYRFEKIDMSEKVFEIKKRALEKLGFKIESEINGRSIQFSEY